MNTMTFRLAVVFTLVIQCPQLLATTPLSASMNMTSFAEFEDQFDGDIDTDSWGILLSPLGVATTSVVLTVNGQPSIETGGSAAASWTDANHGNISFDEIGWTFYIGGDNASVSASDDRSWRYQFLAEDDGYFRIRTDITANGSDLFGLNGFHVGVLGGPQSFQGASHINSDDPTGSFAFEAQLTGGSVYTAFLLLQSNIAGGGARTAYMDADFNWRIVAIPEPAALAMLTIGFGMVGAFSRRRL